MACDAQTLVTAAASAKLASLSDRALLEAILYGLCAVPGAGTSAQTLTEGAATQGYAKFSDRDLMEAILVVVCGGP